MKVNFADRLAEKIRQKNTRVCVGLDPRFDSLPNELKKLNPAIAFLEFNKKIIDAVAEHAVVVKPQSAFYEVYGATGVQAFADTIKYAQSRGLLVIADAKRNDVDSQVGVDGQRLPGNRRGETLP